MGIQKMIPVLIAQSEKVLFASSSMVHPTPTRAMLGGVRQSFGNAIVRQEICGF